MKITVVGTGYVGLVTGACLADCGNSVTCLDVVEEKVRMLREGQMPLYEPGLEALVRINTEAGRLHFTTNQAAVSSCQLVFLTVGTPPDASGAPDLTALMRAIFDIAPYLASDAVVVIKSTVPVGTNARIEKMLTEILGRPCDVVSNPEFLSEGTAVRDFVHPDRIILGTRRAHLGKLMEELYRPFLQEGAAYLVMGWESAELTKYVSNCMLAMKVAFINEVATICDMVGADISEVRNGMGTDHRIGFEFIAPGPGYGGSCFPKDVKALESFVHNTEASLPLIQAIEVSNHRHKLFLGRKIEEHFRGNLRGQTIAIWGLAFKPGTDDIRESPAVTIIDQLLKQGVNIRVHDPAALENIQRIYGDALTYVATPGDAIVNAAALVILTEWDVYRLFAPADIAALMASPTVFDGRYLFSASDMQQLGINYQAIGCVSREKAPVHQSNGHSALVSGLWSTSDLPPSSVNQMPH